MIQEFISELKRDGFTLAKPYLFYVQFYGKVAERKLSFLCHSAVIPSWNVNTVQNRIYGYNIELPSDISFTPAQFSFYIDRKWEVAKIFYDMKKKMFNEIDFSPEYYENYTFDADIIVLDNSNNGGVVATFKLLNCFVRNFNVQPMSWASVNTIQQANLDIAYERFEEDFSATTTGIRTPNAQGLMNRLISSPSSIMDEIGSSMNFDTVRQLAPDIAQGFNLGSEMQPPIPDMDSAATELRDTLTSTFSRTTL